MSDELRGALIAAIAALAGAVIGGVVSFAGITLQLRHEDKAQLDQLKRSVYQKYLLAEQNLLRQVPITKYSSGADVPLKTFLAESKTWINAQAAWQNVADQQDRISLYASDAVLNSVVKCTNAEGKVAGSAQAWYEEVLTRSKSNPIAARSLVRSANTDVEAAINRADPICVAARRQMRSETGIGH